MRLLKMAGMNIPAPSEIINARANGRGRCPGCGTTKEMGAICPWISPTGILVCTYGICRKCADRMECPPPLRTFAADGVERTLLLRYPDLRERLPAGYEPKGEGTGNQ